jgi:xanthine/CO dehydrogenase XdhC/CoxF family maturation factor
MILKDKGEEFMVTILRNPDHTIKTYSEKGADFVLAPGEYLDEVEGDFAEYAGRLKISACGRSGESLVLPAGTPAVEVRVSCPGRTSVVLETNNEEKEITLENGAGSFTLALEDGKSYLIRPHDRREFCAAGEALLAVVVEKSTQG